MPAELTSPRSTSTETPQAATCDTPAVAAESAEELNCRLRKRYAEVVDLTTLRRLASCRDLSSLFVTSVSNSYLRSTVRLMIVGRETSGWGSKLSKDLASPERSSTIETYLKHQMEYHQQMIGKVKAKSKFFQFYRAAAQQLAAPCDREFRDAPAWANLFCFDADGTRPDRDSQSRTEIVRLSIALLRAQIEVLQPELIVFVTGTSCDRYLREHFKDRFESKVYISKRIWRFKLPIPASASGSPHTIAFRTPHPRHSATCPDRAAVIAEALTPGFVEEYITALSYPTRDKKT
jgi:hypothetical protein